MMITEQRMALTDRHASKMWLPFAAMAIVLSNSVGSPESSDSYMLLLIDAVFLLQTNLLMTRDPAPFTLPEGKHP
jgi:hypothetical protein